MDFKFEKVLASDSETYKVQLNGEYIGCIFKDKDKKLWAAMCPESKLIESEVWKDRESAAQHLAKKAGTI